MPTPLEIGKRIKRLREEVGFSQDQLAKQLGITRQSICNYETGDSKPGDELKRKIAVLFDKSIEDIFFKD